MPQTLILQARTRYVHLLIQRENEAFCAREHEAWRRAIRRAKAVERHISRLNDALDNEQWLAIYHGRRAA